jgi:hypothetical protein
MFYIRNTISFKDSSGAVCLHSKEEFAALMKKIAENTSYYELCYYVDYW